MAEDDSRDEEGECGREVSDQDTNISSDQGQSLDENASSDDSDSDTLEHTDSAKCQFAGSNNISADTTSHTPVAPSNPAAIQLLAKNRTKWELTNFLSESRGRAQPVAPSNPAAIQLLA